MAGLIPFRGGVIARRITKVGEHSNPVIRSFIIFLRRGSYKVGFAHNPSEADCFSMRIRPDETALQNFSNGFESDSGSADFSGGRKGMSEHSVILAK